MAKGQIVQSKTLLALQDSISSTMFFNKANLCEEGWPDLQCHKLKVSTIEVELQELTLFIGKWEDNLDKTSETDFGKATWEEPCNV